MEEYESDLSEGEGQQKTSRINSGVLQVWRLDGLWKDAAKHARLGLYSKWNDDLDMIWCELGGDFDENSDEQRAWENLNKKFAECINVKISQKKGFEKMEREEKLSLIRQKYVLIEKQVFLKRMENKLGKGTAYNDDAMSYLDR